MKIAKLGNLAYPVCCLFIYALLTGYTNPISQKPVSQNTPENMIPIQAACDWGTVSYPIGTIYRDNGGAWVCGGDGAWVKIG